MFRISLQEHERQQRAAIAMKFPNDPRNQEIFLARLKDQLEKRLAELKQWHARKKLEEQQYRHGLRQQQMVCLSIKPQTCCPMLNVGSVILI